MADLRLTRAMLQSLRSMLRTRTPKRTDERTDSLMLWAFRKPERVDAVVAAVQTLRDLGEITRGEAVYLFDYLIGLARDDRELDPGISKLIVESPEDDELAMIAMSHHDMVLIVDFYTSHGEAELAEMFEKDQEAYATLRAEGQISLLEYKHEHHPREKRAASVDPGVVMEKVIALSAAEETREWLPAWKALCDALETVTPEAAVAAIQSARELGAISFGQSVSLLDEVTGSLYWHEAELDREYHRLADAIEEADKRLAIDYSKPDDQQPFEWRVLNAQMERRKSGLLAVVMRRLGEHRIADLLVNDPAEYDRFRQEEE